MMPELPLILGEAMPAGRHVTRRRRQLINDQQWYAHPHVRLVRRKIQLDHFIYSFYPLDPPIWTAMGFHRAWGRADFTAREARMVHIVMAEVPWLHRIEEPDGTTQYADALPPRLRTVQGLLVAGWDRRRIAANLGVSQNTARTYISHVYRHFGVGSQRELIARFSLGDGGDQPMDDRGEK